MIHIKIRRLYRILDVPWGISKRCTTLAQRGPNHTSKDAHGPAPVTSVLLTAPKAEHQSRKNLWVAADVDRPGFTSHLVTENLKKMTLALDY